jgi:hypothetical protein
MKNKLVTFRTNQTILAQVDCVDDKTIIVKAPVQVLQQVIKEGLQLGFAPFLEYTVEFDTGIKFNMSDILCITTPNATLEAQYNKLMWDKTPNSSIEISESKPQKKSKK